MISQKRASQETKEEARSLRQRGMGYRDIAKKLGFSSRAVYCWINPDSLTARNGSIHAKRSHEKKRLASTPVIYAIFFPKAAILKIGTDNSGERASLKNARVRMRRKGLHADDGIWAWERAGSKLEETYMQSSMSFRLVPAFQGKSSRLSEWFYTHTYSCKQLTAILDVFHANMPVPIWHEDMDRYTE